MKVFRMNDTDWMAGESLESAIAAYCEMTGIPERELDEPRELTDHEMVNHEYWVDGESDSETNISFREQLDLMVKAGAKFPCLFATTEC